MLELLAAALLLGPQKDYPKPPDCADSVQTASGIRHCVIRAGTGRRVQPDDVVLVHYILWLGEKGDNFYVVSSGEFAAYLKAVGDDKPVKTYGVGGSFGELALMYNCPRAATVP